MPRCQGYKYTACERYLRWMDELAAHVGRSKADTISEALRSYAQAEGFRSPPARCGAGGPPRAYAEAVSESQEEVGEI